MWATRPTTLLYPLCCIQQTRLNFKVGYTLSKAMDNGSGRGDQEFYGGDTNFFRCLSDYDSRHNFTANYTYELPFDKVFHFMTVG